MVIPYVNFISFFFLWLFVCASVHVGEEGIIDDELYG
jgi:hypothetical protein